MRTWHLAWVLAGTILAAGCGGSGAGPDAGPLDSGDGGADGAAGDGGDTLPSDLDLDGGPGLWIPAGSRAFPIGGTGGLEDQLRWNCRVTFRPGLVRLPRDQDSFSGDLIEKIEFTPGQGDPVPEGPGTFTRSVTGTEQDGTLEYRYHQAFQSYAGRFLLDATFAFDVAAGTLVAPLTVLDSPGMLALGLRDPRWLAAGFEGGEELIPFFPCDYPGARRNTYEFGLSGGDTLEVEEWMVEISPAMVICAARPVRLTYTRGGDAVVVEDFFRLAYVPGNHSVIQSYAVRFEPALGAVAGLLIQTQSLGIPLAELSSIFPLDANLVRGAPLSITAASYRGTPCGMEGP